MSVSTDARRRHVSLSCYGPWGALVRHGAVDCAEFGDGQCVDRSRAGQRVSVRGVDATLWRLLDRAADADADADADANADARAANADADAVDDALSDAVDDDFDDNDDHQNYVYDYDYRCSNAAFDDDDDDIGCEFCNTHSDDSFDSVYDDDDDCDHRDAIVDRHNFGHNIVVNDARDSHDADCDADDKRRRVNACDNDLCRRFDFVGYADGNDSRRLAVDNG